VSKESTLNSVCCPASLLYSVIPRRVEKGIVCSNTWREEVKGGRVGSGGG
jgi:hypothetical protein